MTLAEITARITMYTGASAGASGQFKDSDRLVAINKAYDDANIIIISAQDESDFDDKNNTTFSDPTTDIKAGQNDYALPAEILRIKRLEVSYDGVTWNRATPFDTTETGEPLNTASVLDDFSPESPYYDIQNNSIILYPKPTQDVTDGLKIWEDRGVTAFSSSDLSAGTKSPGLERQFHDIIALKSSYDWLLSKTDKSGKIDRIQNKINEMEMNMREFYGNKQLDRKMALNGGYTFSDFS